MYFKYSPLFFLVLLGFSYAQGASPNCSPGDLICDDVVMGQTCYDPTMYSCPVGSSGSILCGFQHLPATTPDGACGTICYDLADYVCCDDTLYSVGDPSAPCSGSPSTSAPTEAPTEVPTAAPTTAPTTGGCASTMCANGEQCCDDTVTGPRCYDPSFYSCPVGSRGPVLCGFQHLPDMTGDQACGTVCYDTIGYVCCGETVYSTDDPNAPCTVSTPVQPPTQAPTQAPTQSPTSAPVTGCASTDCEGGYQCCDDTITGPRCYDPALYSCPSGSQGPVLCGFQHLPDTTPDAACGTVCYDTMDYMCCDDRLYSMNDPSAPCASAPTTSPTAAPTQAPVPPSGCAITACDNGMQCCDDVMTGPRCYDSALYSCPVGSVGPVLCGFQHLPDTTPDAACGTICYDTLTYVCCDDRLFSTSDPNAPCVVSTPVQPTQSPTAAPTQSPTAVPTQMPTQLPTQGSTQTPTAPPTQMPTQMPTQSPTQAASPAPTGSGKLWGINYNTRQSAYSCPDQATVENDIRIISDIADRVRLYSLVDCEQAAAVMQAIHDLNSPLRVTLGIWLDTYHVGEFENEYAALMRLVESHGLGNVDTIIVGSETQYRGDFSADLLIGYIRNISTTVKVQLGYSNIKIATADVIFNLVASPNIIAAEDIVIYNEFPFWEGVTAAGALNTLVTNYALIANANQGKQILIGETGWPGTGDAVGAALPNESSTDTYLHEVVCWARSQNLGYYWFAAFDDEWRDEDAQKHWGLYSADRVLKGPVQLPVAC